MSIFSVETSCINQFRTNGQLVTDIFRRVGLHHPELLVESNIFWMLCHIPNDLFYLAYIQDLAVSSVTHFILQLNLIVFVPMNIVVMSILTYTRHTNFMKAKFSNGSLN